MIPYLYHPQSWPAGGERLRLAFSWLHSGGLRYRQGDWKRWHAHRARSQVSVGVNQVGYQTSSVDFTIILSLI